MDEQIEEEISKDDSMKDGELRVANLVNWKQSYIEANGNTLKILNRLPFWYRFIVAFKFLFARF